MELCAACPREARGFGWFKPRGKCPTFKACSMECMNLICERQGEMKNASPNEIESIIDGSVSGGKYLDLIKKTDLATMSREEWLKFNEVIIDGFIAGMRLRAGKEMRRIPTPDPVSKPYPYGYESPKGR